MRDFIPASHHLAVDVVNLQVIHPTFGDKATSRSVPLVIVHPLRGNSDYQRLGLKGVSRFGQLMTRSDDFVYFL